jgi:hypothetical protein
MSDLKMMKLNTKSTLLCALGFSGFSIGLAAQHQQSYDFFADRETIAFTLSTDLVELLADRSQESQERPGEVRYLNADGSTAVVPVQVKTRGSFRLDPNICDFPPIRLNFRRQDVPRTLFAGQDKIKMVTHCLTPDPEYQQFAILEYLVYRAYETLSPRSFRTRLAEVTYEDASGTFGAITRYGFLIEDVEDVAIRNAAKVVEY